MRPVTRYPEAVKSSFLAKAMAPNGPSLLELSEEFNVPYPTAYSWRRSMLKSLDESAPKRPSDRSAKEKLEAVLATHNLSPEEQSAYCREQGIYSIHLKTWAEEMLAGLGKGSRKGSKSSDPDFTELTKQNKVLERELEVLRKDLGRKEKALAEVSALLVLKKKANLLWGVKEDDA